MPLIIPERVNWSTLRPPRAWAFWPVWCARHFVGAPPSLWFWCMCLMCYISFVLKNDQHFIWEPAFVLWKITSLAALIPISLAEVPISLAWITSFFLHQIAKYVSNIYIYTIIYIYYIRLDYFILSYITHLPKFLSTWMCTRTIYEVVLKNFKHI